MSTGVVYGAPETLSVTCDTDLSLKGEYAANLDTSDEGNVDIAADATKFPFPIVEGAAGATGAKLVMAIAIGGCAKVKCGGTVLPGDKLTADSAGKWIATTANGEHYGAIALEAGAANDVIHVAVRQGVDNVAY